MHRTHTDLASRRASLLAHGSATRPLLLFLLAICGILLYGWFFVTSSSEQDALVCSEWLRQYEERVDSHAIFARAGCGFKDITATSNGIYSSIDIRTETPCTGIPRPLDMYFSQNKLGLLMHVRLHTADEEGTTCSSLY